EDLDPLAVLESIFEPGERHFYAERPSEGWAVAGAESVLAFSARGPGRFDACQRFIDEALVEAVAVGEQGAPFGGPHFFAAFSFLDSVSPDEPFEAARVFVPRWQIARRDGRTTAVANLLVDVDSPIEALAARVWRAHSKFRSFDFRSPELPDDRAGACSSVDELGGRRAYEAAVRRAVGRISRGEFEKIVLARAKDVAAAAPFHPLRMLNGLRQRFPDCSAFSVANGRGQSFIGASPERLLRVDGRVALTEALAGSTGRGATASEDASLGSRLLHSEKDLREQRIVLDSILRVLGPLGLQLSHPARPLLRRLSNVQHLHTPVEARLPEGVRLLDILGRLHPTPAVGGTPRELAVPAIGELEPFPRGLYGGAIGWLDSRGGGEFVVGLRSALVDGSRARMYAGAGIVAGSSPETEFAETELKFRAMQDALLGA
ncbi:MAG TPA: isochorismate synthase, partial [Opitutaceae bacterium]|nr:isochorismate synthase [Opitutaceae bacterium]